MQSSNWGNSPVVVVFLMPATGYSRNLFNIYFYVVILDRHRAMGDVDAMVNIFTQTPLRKLLHHMKYSSTKERFAFLHVDEMFKYKRVLGILILPVAVNGIV